MSPITIAESGLTFGPFSERECFPVEQSALYHGIRQGVKMVEFVLLRPGRGGTRNLLYVEAKHSAPRPASGEDFEEYFGDVREKMLNALLLFLGAHLGRHGDAAAEAPEALRAVDLSTVGIRFVLVVATAEDTWLPPLQDKLRQVLQPVVRTFGIAPPGVAVLNAARARAQRLVMP